MIPPVSSIAPITVPDVAQVQSTSPSAGGFQSVLEGIIGQVEQSQTQAQQATQNFLSGGNEELHSVALAAQRASLEFELFLSVRNKVTSAYQEIMRMQV
ncbi:MAG TPA: flagellar hook-basal body complex protein FliE [Bryobacteraceae bacterium]|jgi:flagellar hook-basal body complex protein FliE|nr:flagellar hook-basal body complex protein FliE [Bryobacteraceae bacterium]